MGSCKINLEKQTAASIIGITCKLTETKPGEYSGVCLNPKNIPPDDLGEDIRARMIKEAGVFILNGVGQGERAARASRPKG